MSNSRIARIYNRTNEQRIKNALNLIIEYGSVDGAHHKDWVLDQIARILHGGSIEGRVCEDSETGEIQFQTAHETQSYKDWVKAIGEEYYDCGIAP